MQELQSGVIVTAQDLFQPRGKWIMVRNEEESVPFVVRLSLEGLDERIKAIEDVSVEQTYVALGVVQRCSAH